MPYIGILKLWNNGILNPFTLYHLPYYPEGMFLLSKEQDLYFVRDSRVEILLLLIANLLILKLKKFKKILAFC